MLTVAITLSSLWSEGQWDYLLAHFKPDNVVVLGEYQTTSANLRDAPRSYEGFPGTRILLAPQSGAYIQGEVSLLDLQHPEDAIYIFGSDNRHAQDIDYDKSVYIPTDTHDEMYSWIAGAITLWHRRYG